MYIDYNMAEIALMICAVSSLSASVGGGFYMFKKEQENAAKEELIAEKKASPYVTIYSECDYKEEIGKVGEEDDFVEAVLAGNANAISIASILHYNITTLSNIRKVAKFNKIKTRTIID